MERIKIIKQPNIKVTSRSFYKQEKDKTPKETQKLEKFIRSASTSHLQLGDSQKSVRNSRNSQAHSRGINFGQIPSQLHQTVVNGTLTATSKTGLSQSTKSLLSMQTRVLHDQLRLPKIQSHVGANPKWIKL